MLGYFNRRFLINLITVLIIFSLDRISKSYVILLSEKNLSHSLFQSKYLNISLVWNEGIAFGLLSFDEKYFYNLLTILIMILVVIIFFMILKNESFKKFSLLLVFGGALGNLYDRIFYKAVPDFIDFHIGNFHWFIFNVSDIFITTGVLLLIILELIYKKDKIDEKT